MGLQDVCKGCVGGVSGHMTPTQVFEHDTARITPRAMWCCDVLCVLYAWTIQPTNGGDTFDWQTGNVGRGVNTIDQENFNFVVCTSHTKIKFHSIYHAYHYTKITFVRLSVRNGRSVETIRPRVKQCYITGYWALEARKRGSLWAPAMA